MKILSIAIPTYNRGKFLERALKQIFLQYEEVSKSIEIIVCDNCSQDNTEQVVSSFKNAGLPIKYFRNSSNVGFDRNIEQCYKVSQGDYICALGDDDFFKIGALKFVTELIQNADFGVIYLEGDHIDSNISVATKIDYTVFNNSIAFLKRLTHNVSFISAVIIKKDCLTKLNFQEYYGTSIAHVPFVIDTILLNERNCYVTSKLFNYQHNNSSFDIFQVFSKNFSQILLKYPKQIRNIISNQLVIDLSNSVLIYREKSDKLFLKTEFTKLYSVYGSYLLFWVYMVPFFLLPLRIVKFYRYVFIHFKLLITVRK